MADTQVLTLSTSASNGQPTPIPGDAGAPVTVTAVSGTVNYAAAKPNGAPSSWSADGSLAAGSSTTFTSRKWLWASAGSSCVAAVAADNTWNGARQFTGAGPTMRQLDGTATTWKAASDSTQGAWDLTDFGQSGYGLHAVAGAGNNEQALIGLGQDYGTAGGILISMKNTGVGINIAQNPNAFGPAIKVDGYSTHERPLKVTNYVGTLPSQLISGQGQAFEDGVANGTTTFTSATATFTANDVGAAITQLASTATTPSVIPAGTTIASFTNSTTVVLSQATTGSVTAIPFFIGTGGIAVRTPAASQSLLDIKGGVTGQVLIQVYNNQTDANPTFYAQGSGILNWGAGGASSADSYIRRFGVGLMQIGSFSATNPGVRIGSGGALYFGSGVPAFAPNADGDIFFRTDGGAGSTIYQRRTGAWVATGA
jgi:hypothetical protein